MLDHEVVRAEWRRPLMIATGITCSVYANPLLDAATLLLGEAVAARIAHLDGEHA